MTCPRRHTDALAEIRKVQRHSEHPAVEGLALVRIDRVADPEHAADVEHLDDIPGLDRRWHMARVAEERLAVTECAHHDVAFAHFGHTAAGELQRVVGRLVGQDLNHDHHAFLGWDVGRDPDFMREAAGLRHGGDFVDDHTSHVADHVRYPSYADPRAGEKR